MELGSEKILLVEDNVELTKVLEDLFSLQGWQTVIAGNVTEAKNKLEELQPNIIISDLMLPGEKGNVLYEYIKNETKFLDLPFVFLTSSTDENFKQSALEQGCEAYLNKPFCPTELTALVKGQINKYKYKKESKEKVLLEDRKRIIQTLSHEFRTPLVSINTGSELILQNSKDLKQEQVQNLISSIYRGGKRLEKLVSDFLVMQQINSGLAKSASEKYKSVHSINSMVQKAISNVADGFIDDTPCIIYEGCEQEIEVEVYAIQVVDAIGRLIENALKYSPDKTVFLHSVEGSIKKGKKQDSSNILSSLVIRDFGLGISDIEQLVVDDIFNQVDRNKQEQQGCGFGLYIVNQFAKLNNIDFRLELPNEGPGVEAILDFKITK